MITLGLNYIGGLGHDSAAAIATDGKLEFAIAEERLTRKKQDGSFPIRAIEACLAYKGISMDEVDQISVGWPRLKSYASANLELNLRGILKESIPMNALNWYRSRTTRHENVVLAEHGLENKPITFLDHHLAHALSVVPYLKAEKSLIFVVDGRGVQESTSVYLKRGFELELLKRVNFPNSFGLFYGEITSMCGFRKNSDEWKVMGLAPFGNKSFDLGHLISSSDGNYKVNHKELLDTTELVLDGKKITRPPNDEVAIHDDNLKDLARSAQDHYERTILDFIGHYTAKHQIDSIGMAGGVGLNCKANGFVMRELQLSEFFIQPAATDDGTAIGAALYPFYENKTLKKETFFPYLGNEYSDEEIEAVLNKYRLEYEYVEAVEEDAAKELASKKIIGWYQGRDEFGPRALGNRSILSDPRTAEMKDKVNEVVKYREGWRPFAPSILEEDATKVLQNIESSPYMILTDYAKEEYADKIPAVVHVDGTLRPQTVSQETNPRYWKLINEFKKLSGVPVVMNTSFNLKGEPNVSHPTDAVRTFFTSGLEVLYVGNYKVSKK